MLTKSQIRAILDKMEVFQDGHFVHKGGRHASQGLFPMRVLQAPEYTQSLATTLASSYRTLRPQVVLAGPGAGALLGHQLARSFHARLVYCLHEGGRWDVSPGQALQPGERVLICEDVVSDPSELLGRVELVRASGAEMVGVAALFDLTPTPLPWPLEAVLRPEIELTHPAGCPQCASGVPLSAPKACVVV
jgi:orotate phosphoribosyltransferase